MKTRNRYILSLGVITSLSSFLMADTVGDIDAEMSSTDIAGKYSSEAKEALVTASETLKQNIKFGSANTSGNSETQNINGKYDMSFSNEGLFNELMKVKFDISGFVAKSDKKRVNEEYSSNLGFEQIIGDGWLAYTSALWFKNNFKNLDRKLSFGAGIGNEIFKTDKQSLTFKIGAGYNIENYIIKADFDGELLSSRKFGSLNEYIEYNYQFNTTNQFFLKLGASENFEDIAKDYDILTSLGFNFSIAENLSISLTQEITFDAIPVGDKKTDTKTIVSLGYNF